MRFHQESHAEGTVTMKSRMIHTRPLMLTVAVSLFLGESGSLRAVEPAHFHHVRLNVVDVSKSMRFYQRFSEPCRLSIGERPERSFVERSFLLFNTVASPAGSASTRRFGTSVGAASTCEVNTSGTASTGPRFIRP